MDWLLQGVSHHLHHKPPPGQGATVPAAGTAPAWQGHPLPRPAMVPQMQGDPTFLYGGYGYRPPTFGYAWMNGASQPTSYAQLPTDTGTPKTLSKSVSAPDLQNAAAVQELQKQAQQPVPQQPHSKMQGTPPLPRHNKHLSTASAPPGTPAEHSPANTPSSSRPSTPPRRGGLSDSFYIGMAAA